MFNDISNDISCHDVINSSHRRITGRETRESARAWHTIIHVLQDIDFGGGVVHPQTAPDRQRQGDVEALLSLVERVVDDHDATLLLPFTPVKAKDADMLLQTGDVVRVRQNGGGNRPRGRTFEGTSMN